MMSFVIATNSKTDNIPFRMSTQYCAVLDILCELFYIEYHIQINREFAGYHARAHDKPNNTLSIVDKIGHIDNI